MPYPLARRSRSVPLSAATAVLLTLPAGGPMPLAAQGTAVADNPPSAVRAVPACARWQPHELRHNPTAAELRCRYGIRGPGRFGLSEYFEVPVYQSVTPLPGTHVVGVPGLPAPRAGETFEEWEWRMLRAEHGPAARRVHRELELLHPFFASRILTFERRLTEVGVRFRRRETWRSPERQAYLFQQGRSRPGPIVTTTLTSWHSWVDAQGIPSAWAADYDVPRAHLPRFHEIAWEAGLETYGPDSHDPGHVFLPGREFFPAAEVVLLRLLPYVPPVTIVTGRPVDEPVRRERRPELLRATEEFVGWPFVPYPLLRLAGPSQPLLLPDTAWRQVERPPFVHARPRGALQALVGWLGRRGR